MRGRMGYYNDEWRDVFEWMHFVAVVLIILYCHRKVTNAVRETQEEIILGREDYKTCCQCGSTGV